MNVLVRIRLNLLRKRYRFEEGRAQNPLLLQIVKLRLEDLVPLLVQQHSLKHQNRHQFDRQNSNPFFIKNSREFGFYKDLNFHCKDNVNNLYA